MPDFDTRDRTVVGHRKRRDGQGNVVGIDSTGDGIVDTFQSAQPPVPQNPYLPPQTFQIIVPPGAFPGAALQINHPTTGQLLTVTVPPGRPPGSMLEVSL